MAEVKNAFIKSKMNKDLDARILPSGEYRNAINAQISRSEGADVGALENVLGNKLEHAFETSVPNLFSIGYFVDEVRNNIYVFLTDNQTSTFNPTGVGSNHFIFQYNTSTGTPTKLVEGAFLNFSTISPIHGVNLLESLLFFTDNRNQPRKINIDNTLGYYTTEDQISVARFSPYESIELWQENSTTAGEYETTMKDVISKAYPSGGTCKTVAITALTSFPVTDASFGEGIYIKNGDVVEYINSTGNIVPFTPAITVGAAGYNKTTKVLEVSSAITLASETTLVINPNTYYQKGYNGDPNFLTDKFVRFSYRFRFDDGEYSIMAPFTQPAFIPQQDGYFLNSSQTAAAYAPQGGIGDQQQTFESTVVDFMQNKVNKINLRIPLPTSKATLGSTLHITAIDILYKESDGLAVQVITTIPVDNTFVGTDTIFDFEYQSQKPYKTLPEKDLIRVYDKTPVKALSQEIISNRVVYGNFQDKHTPPASLNYNVNVTEKSPFDLQTGAATQNGALVSPTSINLSNATGNIQVGSIISGSGIPTETSVVTVTGSPATNVTVNKDVTSVTTASFTFTPAGEDQNTTSIIEYPNSSVKTNRNYQIGVVLSDKFGRQSTTILSNNKDSVVVQGQTYIGSTLYSPYIDSGTDPSTWPGNSLKLLFNDPIESTPNTFTNYPGVYNGDVTSLSYNPLGWYSYKVVVKQTEQEYYNVYTAGALKGDPTVNTQDLSNSSIVLINDNINKVPRDLSEVGPTDRTYRSSVQLFGRVENIISPTVGGTPQYSNTGNQQYYPTTRSFTTNTIEDLYDSFDVASSLVTTAECYQYDLSGVANEQVSYDTCDGVTTVWTAIPGSLSTTVCAKVNTPVATTGAPTILQKPNECSVNIPITSTDNPFHAFFRAESDPFLAYMTTSQIPSEQFGVANSAAKPFVTVENLAILETEATESRLDIFWETSTAGSVIDLNNLILNDSGGSSGFSDFNSSNFTEAAGPGNLNVLSSNFALTDNLGADLNPTLYSTFALTLNTVISDGGVDNTSYFVLNRTAALNDYNIAITNAFLQNVFYQAGSGSSTVSPTKWTFSFSWVLTDTATSTTTTGSSTKLVDMGNESPVIYLNDGTTPAPATEAITIDFSSTATIKSLKARNGAYNGATAPQNSNTGSQLVWSLEARKTVNGTEGDSNSLFSSTNSSTSTESSFSFNWLNTGAAVGYTVTIKVTDANDLDAGEKTDTIVYTISSGLTTSATNYCYTGNCGGSQPENFQPSVVFISGAANSQYNGYYLFVDRFEDLPVVNGNVQLNWTDAYKGVDDPDECGREAGNYNGLMFGSSLSVVFGYYDGTDSSTDCSACGNTDSGNECVGACGQCSSTYSGNYPITIDTSSITFDFI